MSDKEYRHGLEAQLDAASECIAQLRSENAMLFGAVRFVREFHDDCVCRQSRRALDDAYAYVTGEAIPSTQEPLAPAGASKPTSSPVTPEGAVNTSAAPVEGAK